MVETSIYQALRLARKGVGIFAVPTVTAPVGAQAGDGATTGSVVTALADPFAGFGLGTTTWSTFGTVPPQLALTGSTVVKGSGGVTNGASYTIGVIATSGDGLHKRGFTITIGGILGTAPSNVVTFGGNSLTYKGQYLTFGTSQ